MKRLGIFLLTLGLAGCDLLPSGILPGGSNDAPSVLSVNPDRGASNVSVGAQINAALNLPNGGLSLTTVDGQSVRLVNMATGAVVEASVDVDNDAQTLTLDPAANLDFATEYQFTITSAVQDAEGAAFQEYSSTFSTLAEGVPFVVSTTPADGATNVPINTSITTTQISTSGGVDPSSLTEDSVYLVNVSSGERVASRVNTSGGGDTIGLVPEEELEPQTTYQFNVTSAVRDSTGEAFVPYTATFTTGTQGAFTGEVSILPQSTAARERHSSLAFGPESDLYATMIDGRIRRYPVASDGTLGSPETITSLVEAEGGPRLTIGLAFDPASTPSNPIVWVTHTYLDLNNFDGSVGNGIDQPWSGKLTRLSGPNLENVEDIVVGLPRSSKDHVTNSVAFNPAEPGVVYFVQGSNTAMGAPDTAWKFQEERVLSGAVLRLDTSLLGSTPLNVQTEDGGTYDPYAPNAPLTVYGSGTRNSYDLVWHSNGNLYVPANGSAAGGNVPRYDPIPGTCEDRPNGDYSGTTISDPSALPNYIATGVNADGETVDVDGWKVNETMNDYLFKIEEGGYYGTPNPKRCEWILFGGSVGTGDRADVINLYRNYSSPVRPDPSYGGYTYNFGANVSPNGAIEYKGGTFSGLEGKLLVTRYSQYDDVIALEFDGSGNVTSGVPIIPKSRFIIDPIEIAEDPSTGYLYVSSYDQLGGQAAPRAGIVLVKPQ